REERRSGNQAVNELLDNRRCWMVERPRRTLSSSFAAVSVALVGWYLSAASLSAQAPGPSITLGEAVQMALKNYPALKERRARAQAAEEGVSVAKTAYLPRLDVLWQENRATTNNVFGMLLPQSTIFSMTGPVLGTRSLSDSVWGSAVGA